MNNKHKKLIPLYDLHGIRASVRSALGFSIIVCVSVQCNVCTLRVYLVHFQEWPFVTSSTKDEGRRLRSVVPQSSGITGVVRESQTLCFCSTFTWRVKICNAMQITQTYETKSKHTPSLKRWKEYFHFYRFSFLQNKRRILLRKKKDANEEDRVSSQKQNFRTSKQKNEKWKLNTIYCLVLLQIQNRQSVKYKTKSINMNSHTYTYI